MVPMPTNLAIDQVTGSSVNFSWLAWLLPLIILLAIWEMVWKAVAMWKAARNNQLTWYVVLLIFNTIGILPILYVAFWQKKQPITLSE